MHPLRLLLSAVLLALVAAPAAPAVIREPPDMHALVREVTIPYVAHDGELRHAVVLLPTRVGPGPLPLVISPHGRGLTAEENARYWGDLPGRYGFVVVSPDGQGRHLERYSWGFPGQIDDLAEMPYLVAQEVPGITIDFHRIYAFGGSMGGQEVLLLAAEHPSLLAGAAAFDPATDMARRYYDFARLPDGRHLQKLARLELGGTPEQVPEAYAVRSPDAYVSELASSGVPLQIWWSTRDRVIRDQADEAGLLYQEIKALNPNAPVEQCRGMWQHTVEMEWNRRLPRALGHFGLRRPASPLPGGSSRYPG